jgi:hypothetical protein
LNIARTIFILILPLEVAARREKYPVFGGRIQACMKCGADPFTEKTMPLGKARDGSHWRFLKSVLITTGTRMRFSAASVSSNF